MGKLFNEKQKERVFLAVLLATGMLRFVNLGFLDLQAWDEALYAVRSESILAYGGVLDQTSHSIGGLYSSLHPPLFVWLTSLSFLLFGVTEFAARFFSALLGGLTLFTIYQIGKEVRDSNVGFIAALLFGLNPLVTFQARQGQFDTTLVFLLTLSVLWYLRSESSNKSQWAFYAGLSIGAALMTKLFVGFGIPLTIFLANAFTHKDGEDLHLKPLLLCLGALTIVALPWHLYMTILHGSGNPLFFLQASAVVDRSLHGVEGNVKPLEVFYYINQCFVLFPIGVIWFAFGLARVFKERDRSWMFLALWFVVFFLVFSLMRTKLSVYLLPMLVPASLIAARIIVEFAAGSYSNRLMAIFLAGTGISLLWASNQEWRNLAKSIPASALAGRIPDTSSLLAFLPFLILFGCIILLVISFYRRERLSLLRAPLATILLLPAFLMSFYSIVGYDRFQFVDGARELSQVVEERQPSIIVVAGFDRNPQLTFYLDGIDIGWREDIEMVRIIPPTIRSEFRSWLSGQVGGLPGDALVIVEKDKIIRYERFTSEEVNPLDYALVYDSKRYAAFQRTRPIHLAEATEGRP